MRRSTRRLLGLLPLLPLLVNAGWAAAASTVDAVRIDRAGSYARLVVGLSGGAVDFRVFTLADPYRLVIDMPATGWRARAPRTFSARGLISALRVGAYRRGETRIVLDLRRPALVHKAVLLGRRGDRIRRLVVDLEAVGRATYRARARARNRIRWARRGLVRGARRGPAARGNFRLPPGRKPRPPGARRPVIVIDAGHGGIDPGTLGRRGTREKMVTLAMALAIRKQLEARGRYRVVLTRDKDVFLRLRARVAVARRAGAALFISLHADSINNRSTRGASVYTLSKTASDREAAALAAKENKADIIAGVDLGKEKPDVADILIDLAQRETMALSARFAVILVRELGRETRLLRRTHRFAGFAVLKAPDVPSVLIELGYLSNRADERLLRQPRHRAKVARAVSRAVSRYFALRDRMTRS